MTVYITVCSVRHVGNVVLSTFEVSASLFICSINIFLYDIAMGFVL